MSSNQEMQEEEREVLSSIYDGDGNFKQISDCVFQYKIGEDGSCKSFIAEVSWSESYPEELPTINLDLFYNKHIIQSVKEAVQAGLVEQANDLLGMSMTFTLFEWVKDNADSLLAEQPESFVPSSQADIQVGDDVSNVDTDVKVVKEKKEQLTKSQKRRMLDRYGAVAEKPRGWDWVDIIRHLSQTGVGKQDS